MSWHKRLLEYDPVQGKTEWFYSDGEGTIVLETDWDLDVIAENCKGLYNAVDQRAPWKGEWHHVGVIPHAIQEWYLRTHGKNLLTDREHCRHWLNDSANEAFRTRPGKL